MTDDPYVHRARPATFFEKTHWNLMEYTCTRCQRRVVRLDDEVFCDCTSYALSKENPSDELPGHPEQWVARQVRSFLQPVGSWYCERCAQPIRRIHTHYLCACTKITSEVLEPAEEPFRITMVCVRPPWWHEGKAA